MKVPETVYKMLGLRSLVEGLIQVVGDKRAGAADLAEVELLHVCLVTTPALFKSIRSFSELVCGFQDGFPVESN